MEYPILNQAIDEYIAYEKKKNSSRRPYIEKHRITLQAFSDLVRNPRIDEITPSTIRLFFNDIPERNSWSDPDYTLYYPANYFLRPGLKHTIHELRQHFKFWSWISQKYKLVQPLYIPNEEEKRAAVKPIEEEEKRRMLNKCRYLDYIEGFGLIRNPDELLDKAFFTLLIETGFFPESVFKLYWSAIDCEKKVLLFDRIRDGKRMSLPLSDSAIVILQEYLADRKEKGLETRWQVLIDRNGNNVRYEYFEGFITRLFGYKGFDFQCKRMKKTFAINSIRQNHSLHELFPGDINERYFLDEIKDMYSLTDDEIKKCLGLRADEEIDIKPYFPEDRSRRY